MTTGSTASRLQNDSLVGIGAGVIAILIAGSMCSWAKLDQQETTSVMALAIAVPPAVELKIKKRRRDTTIDVARIQRGELRRPVGLMVMLLGAAIVLIDSAVGAAMGSTQSVLEGLGKQGKISDDTKALVVTSSTSFLLMAWGICLFLVACYASQYFATRPYLWTAIAVGWALAIRVAIVLALQSTSAVQAFVTDLGALSDLLVDVVLANLGYLFICLAGVWLGRRYHDAFLAKTLARMEGKVAEEAPDQHSAPLAATLISPPSDPSSALNNHPTTDHFKEIEKLARLHDKGVLTQEEFQAKKSEILDRI